jgi:hypothetical protein
MYRESLRVIEIGEILPKRWEREKEQLGWQLGSTKSKNDRYTN